MFAGLGIWFERADEPVVGEQPAGHYCPSFEPCGLQHHNSSCGHGVDCGRIDPVRDDHCLCSKQLLSVFVFDNVPVLISATFAAPPTSLSSIDVRIPNFGTVRNVPIS